MRHPGSLPASIRRRFPDNCPVLFPESLVLFS
jgi:hypothetical protein